MCVFGERSERSSKRCSGQPAAGRGRAAGADLGDAPGGADRAVRRGRRAHVASDLGSASPASGPRRGAPTPPSHRRRRSHTTPSSHRHRRPARARCGDAIVADRGGRRRRSVVRSDRQLVRGGHAQLRHALVPHAVRRPVRADRIGDRNPVHPGGSIHRLLPGEFRARPRRRNRGDGKRRPVARGEPAVAGGGIAGGGIAGGGIAGGLVRGLGAGRSSAKR
jgi:hypothetical protein